MLSSIVWFNFLTKRTDKMPPSDGMLIGTLFSPIHRCRFKWNERQTRVPVGALFCLAWACYFFPHRKLWNFNFPAHKNAILRRWFLGCLATMAGMRLGLICLCYIVDTNLVFVKSAWEFQKIIVWHEKYPSTTHLFIHLFYLSNFLSIQRYREIWPGLLRCICCIVHGSILDFFFEKVL